MGSSNLRTRRKLPFLANKVTLFWCASLLLSKQIVNSLGFVASYFASRPDPTWLDPAQTLALTAIGMQLISGWWTVIKIDCMLHIFRFGFSEVVVKMTRKTQYEHSEIVIPRIWTYFRVCASKCLSTTVHRKRGLTANTLAVGVLIQGKGKRNKAVTVLTAFPG